MNKNNINIDNQNTSLNSFFNYTTKRTYLPAISNIPREWDFWDYSLLFCLIFGTIGNSLSIMVMSTKRLRNTNAALFVTCMAIADNILLIFKFLASMIKIYHINVYDFCILFYIVIPQAASFISVWLIMITTAERTAAVVYPLRVSLIFSKKRCKIMIASMVVFFLVLTSTAGMCSHHDKDRPYLCAVKGGSGSFYETYFHSVYQLMKSVFGSWLPSLLGICLNIAIIVFLYRASKERLTIASRHPTTSINELKALNETKSTYSCEYTTKTYCPMKKQTIQSRVANSSSNKERQITIMLLTISISFVILTMPYSLYELVRKLVSIRTLHQIVHKDNVRKFQRATLLLVDLNHSTNFIFYVLTAERFRNQLKVLLMFWRKDRKSKLNYETTIRSTIKNSTVSTSIKRPMS